MHVIGLLNTHKESSPRLNGLAFFIRIYRSGSLAQTHFVVFHLINSDDNGEDATVSAYYKQIDSQGGVFNANSIYVYE
jgi:hypothetical protein